MLKSSKIYKRSRIFDQLVETEKLSDRKWMSGLSSNERRIGDRSKEYKISETSEQETK